MDTGERDLKVALFKANHSVPSMRHDLSDLELICWEKTGKSVFGFKNPILDFSKETYPYAWFSYPYQRTTGRK